MQVKVLVATLLLGLAGCASTPPPPPIDPDTVVGAVRSVVKKATVGAVVYDRASETEPLSVNADRKFDSASLVKLLIAIDLLAGEPGEDDRNKITRMLSASDDATASAFWLRGGRTDIVRRMVDEIDLTGTEPPANAGRWGEVRITPDDVVQIYQYVLDELPDEDRDLIMNALSSAPRVAADGFNQHFGIPAALHVPWAVKQGWGDDKKTKVLHSTGLVGQRYIVVLLTEHPIKTPTKTAADAVTAGANALTVLFPAV